MMTKEAITVIDQELIDDAESTISLSSDACDRAKISQGTLKELISMCEDLIEINAELTKREQKKIFIIKSLLMAIEKHESCAAVESTSAFELAHEYIDSLKGDSDD